MKPLVIYHANCLDGFGAAFAAWCYFQDNAEYVPASYGAPIDVKIEGREVCILDFSFPRETMELFFQLSSRVTWLDHHKTAFEMWCASSTREYFAQTIGHGQHFILLDNNKSGALLAWEHFNTAPAPIAVLHIDDRDRWQFKLQGTREFNEALYHIPRAFQVWSQAFQSEGVADLYKQGELLLKIKSARVKAVASRARECTIFRKYIADKDVGLAVNTDSDISEVGHELANASGTYGLIWYVGDNGKVKCSLRSNGDYDVSAIAKSFGGGGHKNAAGFELDLQELQQILE